MYELQVRAVSARNLLDKQTFGKQDPYCKLTLGTQKYQTRVHDNGDRTPVWNEKFVFRVVDAQLDQLHVQIKDKGFASNVLIGECRLPVSMFQHGAVVDQWFPLTCRDRRAGEINLRVQLVGAPGGASMPPQAYPANVPYGQKPNKAVYGQVPTAQAYPAPQAYPQAPYAQPQQPYPPQASYVQTPPQQPYPTPNYPVPSQQPQGSAYPAAYPAAYPQPTAYPAPQAGMPYQAYPQPQQPVYAQPVVMGPPPVVVGAPPVVMGNPHMMGGPRVVMMDKHHYKHHGHHRHGHHGGFGETAMGVGAGVLGGMLLGEALESIFD